MALDQLWLPTARNHDVRLTDHLPQLVRGCQAECNLAECIKLVHQKKKGHSNNVAAAYNQDLAASYLVSTAKDLFKNPNDTQRRTGDVVWMVPFKRQTSNIPWVKAIYILVMTNHVNNLVRVNAWRKRQLNKNPVD